MPSTNVELFAKIAVCFGITQCNNPLIPFFKPKNTFFTSTNATFNIITYTHSFCTFNQKKNKKQNKNKKQQQQQQQQPKNWYTRTQPIQFSMIPKI